MILIGIFLGLIATVLHQHLHSEHEAVRDELAFIATLFLIQSCLPELDFQPA